jgi:type I restriction-modification system DNA methylase subunit
MVAPDIPCPTELPNGRLAFRRGKYQDVILPLTVLRRLDCVLAATKEAVLARQAALKDRGLENSTSSCA